MKIKFPGDSILDHLPADRKAAILREAAQAHLRKFLSNGTTFGDLVASLPKSPHWASARNVKVSEVMGGGSQKWKDVEAGRFSPEQIKASRERARTLAEIEGKKSARKRHTLSPKVLDAVFALVKKNPGLRTEALRAKMPGVQVKKALHKLHEQGKVKTTGKRRQTTYKAV